MACRVVGANLNHSVRWVAVRVARPGMLSKHNVNTSYLAEDLEPSEVENEGPDLIRQPVYK